MNGKKQKNQEFIVVLLKILKTDIFIFSEEQQVKETLKKYYKDKENLILLKVHTLNLQHLLWEQASNGDMYPHLYSTLDVKDVKDEFEIILGKDGNHYLPINLN